MFSKSFQIHAGSFAMETKGINIKVHLYCVSHKASVAWLPALMLPPDNLFLIPRHPHPCGVLSFSAPGI